MRESEAAAGHIERSAAEFAQLVSGAADLEAQIPGGEWTVRQTAMHVSAGMRLYRALLLGSDSPARTRDDMRPWNSGVFYATGPASSAALRETVLEAAVSCAAVAATVDADDPRPWHFGQSLPARLHFALVIDECLMHGLDVSRATGLKLTVDGETARYCWQVLAPFLTPARFLPDAAAGVEAVVSMECEGALPIVFALRNGALTLSDAAEPDCVVRGSAMQLLRWTMQRDTWDRSGLSAGGPHPELAATFTDWLRRI